MTKFCGSKSHYLDNLIFLFRTSTHRYNYLLVHSKILTDQSMKGAKCYFCYTLINILPALKRFTVQLQQQDVSKCNTTKEKSDKHHDFNYEIKWREKRLLATEIQWGTIQEGWSTPNEGNKSPACRSLLDKCYLCPKGHFIINVYTLMFIIKFFIRCLVDFTIEIIIKQII